MASGLSHVLGDQRSWNSQGLLSGATANCTPRFDFFRELLLPQLFVAGLKDSDGRIVSYVGVQCEVNQVSVDTMRERAAKLATLDM